MYRYRFFSLMLIVTNCVSAFAQDSQLESLFSAPLENRDAIIQQVTEAEASYKIRTSVEPHIFSALRSSKHSSEAKSFLAQQLYRICDEDSIADLEDLLFMRGTGDLARQGLENINHPDAHTALLNSLPRVSGDTLVGVIQALGRHRDADAIRPLRTFVQSGNSEIVEASIVALGEIGGAEAAEILGMSRLSVNRSLRDTATAAYLRCGWSSLENGDRDTALEVFDALLIEVEPIEIRQEALRGYIRTELEYAIPLVVETLKSNNPAMQAVAVEEAAKIPDVEATQALVKVFSDVKPPIQVQLVRILGERRDLEGMPTVIQSVFSRDDAVRLESLDAAAKFNHPDTLFVLLKTVATGSSAEKDRAFSALESLEGDQVEDELVKSAMSADNAVRLEAVKMIAHRRSERGVPVVVRIAERDIREIQFEALKALGTMGTQEELPLMLKAWQGNWSPEQRTIIGEGIVAIAQRSPAGPGRVDALHDALKSAPSPEVQMSIIHALTQIREDASLKILNDAMRKSPPSVQAEIIRVLTEWPSPEVLPDLEKIARTIEDVALRDLAFEGFVRTLGTTDHSTSDTAKYYQRAVKIANTTDKRRLLFPGVARLTDPLVSRIYDDLAKDPALTEEINLIRE